MNTTSSSTEMHTNTPPALQSIGLSILQIRQQRVILDSELAALYGVETKRLNEAVKRNTEKFPLDFMFQLSRDEFDHLRSQIATSSETRNAHGGRRHLPRVFTEHGTFSRNTRNQLRQVFDTLRQLTTPPELDTAPKRSIGFLPMEK